MTTDVLAEGVPQVISITAVAATSDQTATVLADAPFKSGIDRAAATLSSGAFTP